MSQRDLIRMTNEEAQAFLAEERVVTLATHGPDGRIHLAPLWYGILDGCIAFSTYARSQKVLNIQRDDQVTVLVEGGDSYNELRGVEIVGRAEVVDQARHADLDASIAQRYFGGDDAAVPRHGDLTKRTVVRVIPEKVVSWDHRKLHPKEER